MGNCVLTLTYADQHLPYLGSLDKKAVPAFIKRLRSRIDDATETCPNPWLLNYQGASPRYYYCGEYGSKLLRPHYHLIIFGFEFDDRMPAFTKAGRQHYTSSLLSELWSDKNGSELGLATVSDFSPEAASYVAAYVSKKQFGANAYEHYERLDPATGEFVTIQPEFTNMSRKPGIGMDWLKSYSSDVYPHDFFIFNGHKVKPPKAYDKKMQLEDPELYALVKARRQIYALSVPESEKHPTRLLQKEMALVSKQRTRKRSFEDGT